MPSRSGRSTGRAPNPTPRRVGVAVYLLPAVVGGGLGDIEEVLAAGRWLARAGYPIYVYRRAQHPLPRSVAGPWNWPRYERTARLAGRSAAALTVSPAWGVSAAPSPGGRFGRPGPWAEEVEDVERKYGADRVIHVSLEEFARTLGSRRESSERFREGGVPSRAIPDRLRAAVRTGEVAEFRRAFDRFRAFDRPNVLHLFGTFRRDPAFAREFPQAVQTGPLWSGSRFGSAPSPRRTRQWVWYASPSSAERIAPQVLAGLRGREPPVRLYVRTLRPWRTVSSSPELSVVTDPSEAVDWRRRFARADLRIVTGSRTLLEALEVGGPFLYFNGVLGSGRHVRRHRPEKLAALLELGRRCGVPPSLLRDLSEFARGRAVASVVRRVAARRAGWERFCATRLRPYLPHPYPDLSELLLDVARAMSEPGASASAIVARVRAAANS